MKLGAILHVVLGYSLLFSLPSFANEPKFAGDALDQLNIPSETQNVTWYDPRNSPMELAGFAWVDTDCTYRRLPKTSSSRIPEIVDDLANNTAGGQIRFQTDSGRVFIRAKLGDLDPYYHMTSTALSGFDVYVGEPGKQRFVSTLKFEVGSTDFDAQIFSGEKKTRNFTINFPLYSDVKSLSVGLDTESNVAPPRPFAEEGVIVVYGTSITQGCCASRPGMAYTNILSRRLNSEFINLGFNGNGKGEPVLAKTINKIPKKRMVILDYEANANETLRETLNPFVDILREDDATLPILIVSKIRYAWETPGSNAFNDVVNRAEWQKSMVAARRSKGDQHIYFLNGGGLLGPYGNEATVDGAHPTDLGFNNIALGIEASIRKILSLSSVDEMSE